MGLMRLLLPILGFLLILPSCKRSPTQPSHGSSPAYFPNQVGDTWTYSFYDSISQQLDSVTVTVVGQTTIPGNKPATIWQRVFGSRIDTVYITTSFDTIRIIPKEQINAQWVNTKYLLPLFIGRGWRGDFVTDTSTVVENRPLTVTAGSFPNAFRIEEQWGAFNDNGQVSTWFVPGVGVIRLHRKTLGFGRSNELWELLSYRVSP